MSYRLLGVIPVLMVMGMGAGSAAAENRGFNLEVLVNGVPRPELYGHGKVYVEALRGKSYTLRLTNPWPHRVAVALSVDGLNTIDARHTQPQDARKWVLDPEATIEIEGWQVSGDQARLFYFTGERDSYAARLGRTRDIGVIEAVFFRERQPKWIHRRPCVDCGPREFEDRGEAGLDGAAPQAEAPAAAAESAREKSSARLSNEYAATGMGDRIDHRVHRVHLDLENTPAATLRIRYEFRPQLIRLGLLPHRERDPLSRRESARGFDEPFCPDL